MTAARRPLVIAHAACAGHAPENTLAGIRKALSLGADAIEVDVQATADGVPVLMHDPSVDRTTDGSGPVASLTLAEVKRLDAGAGAFEGVRGEPVPTLAEALELTQGQALLIAEIKRTGIEPRVAEVITQARAGDAIMVWSFFAQALADMRTAAPGLPLALLLAEQTAPTWPRMRELALDLGLQGVSFHHQQLSPDIVRSARQADLSVYAWTVDSERDIQNAIALGVDGIVSNYPERVSAALSA